MISHPNRRFWMLLACLALIHATQNDAGAAPPQPFRARPCGQTIRYKIGAIDSRFGIDQQSVIAAAQEAAELWNEAAGAKAVYYGGAASVTVELVYDARQGLVQHYVDDAAVVKREEALAERIAEDVADLRSRMDTANAALGAERDDFGARRDSYNARVQKLNDMGGGTRQQVHALDQIKLQLDRQGSALKEKADDLDKLNAKADALVKEHNTLVDRINQAVAAANREFGSDIVAGLYTRSGSRAVIEIFAFADRSDLVAILAHEFGHALGLGHSRESGSIMGTLHEGSGAATPLAHLAPGDVAALANVCK